MKRFLPYLLGVAVLFLLAALVLTSRSKQNRQMDERITLRQRDKIPYGTAVAKNLLPSLFPQAAVYFDSRYPGSWDEIDPFESGQAVILVADHFEASYVELDRLSRFVNSGNVVFIISRSISDDAARFFHLRLLPFDRFFEGTDDSLQVKLESPVFQGTTFTYPGKRYQGVIQKLDSSQTVVLGRNEKGWVNFVRLNKGGGSFYLHTAPLAFSNYFLLHKANIAYYENVLSLLPSTTKAILWNEYFLEKMQSQPKDNDVNWLGTLFKNPSFRWGFLTALATLMLYVLLGMRRRQRMIPVYEKPRNESLDFVKTLGRLYYDKGDHQNLASKMGAYFLEHVRSQYHIATHQLDKDFVALLHAKSGYPLPELNVIINDLTTLPQQSGFSEEELARLHKNLELFYQNT